MPRLTDKEIDDAIAAASAWTEDGLDESGYDGNESDYDTQYDTRYEDSGYPVPMYAVLTMQREVQEATFEEWVKYFMASPRRIAQTNINGVLVSTTFLGINLGSYRRPLWFETMVFGGDLDGHCERYTDLEEAVGGHQLVVTTIKEAVRDALKAHSRTAIERVRRDNVVR